MSKDFLDRTLNHNPDRGPDQVADHALNREPARASDRDTDPETGRTSKSGSEHGEKPVAAPAKKRVAASGNKPVAAPGKKPVAAPAKKPAAGAAKKPVATSGKKPVAAPSKTPVVTPGRKPVPARAGASTPAAAPPTAAEEEREDRGSPLDGAVELRSERRVEVVVPIEIQVVVEIPGEGKIRGATENMSCSGMLARLNGLAPKGSRCEVNFVGLGEVEPNRVLGRIIRVAKSRYGYAVAIRFERPVQIKV